MRVLLTGALGNLGSLLIDSLLEQGHTVTAFDVKNTANLRIAAQLSNRYASQYKDELDIHWGDIRDEPMVQHLVEAKDAVIHLAAVIAPFSETNPEHSD
jgi:nucleoside-diphosphate-sugar epimerase